MTLNGVTCTKKTDAGEMLLAVCKENALSQTTGIGSYRGFQLEAFYDPVNRHFCLDLCGAGKHGVDLGPDAAGNLVCIDHVLEKIPAELEEARTKRAEITVQFENAKEEVKKPFAYEEALREKTERLNALNIELNLSEKDTPVMDTEPEQEGERPGKKKEDREQ